MVKMSDGFFDFLRDIITNRIGNFNILTLDNKLHKLSSPERFLNEIEHINRA